MISEHTPTELASNSCKSEDLEYLHDVEHRLAVLLERLTGGLLSKTSYSVDVMEQHIDAHYQKCFEADHAAEIASAERRGAVRALREAGERLDPIWSECDPVLMLEDWADRMEAEHG